MTLQKNIYSINCELGACKAKAEHSIKFQNLGFEHNLHICTQCLIGIHDLVSKNILFQEQPANKIKTSKIALKKPK
jgi:hypothetical protein